MKGVVTNASLPRLLSLQFSNLPSGVNRRGNKAIANTCAHGKKSLTRMI